MSNPTVSDLPESRMSHLTFMNIAEIRMRHPTVSDIPESRICRMHHAAFSNIPESRMSHPSFRDVDSFDLLFLFLHCIPLGRHATALHNKMQHPTLRQSLRMSCPFYRVAI